MSTNEFFKVNLQYEYHLPLSNIKLEQVYRNNSNESILHPKDYDRMQEENDLYCRVYVKVSNLKFHITKAPIRKKLVHRIEHGRRQFAYSSTQVYI